MTTVSNLRGRELALVLAALRLLQRDPERSEILRVHMHDAEDIEPTEIDSLCKALNFAPDPLDRDTIAALADAAESGIGDIRRSLDEGFARRDGCEGDYREALKRFEAAYAAARMFLSTEGESNTETESAPDDRPALPSLYKTTLTIWTDYDPAPVEIDDLAREAVSGDAYCSGKTCTFVANPRNDPAFGDTEFFNTD